MAANYLDLYGIEIVPEEEFQTRYKLSDILGEGGAGCVSAATELSTGRQVAIKQISVCNSREFDLTHIHDTVSEYECLRKLEPAAIVGVTKTYGLLAIHRPQYFGYVICLVMDIVHGSNLEEIFEEEGGLSPKLTNKLAAWLVRTVAAIHDQEVVHRDLQLHNILLSHEEDPYLIDFGEGFDLSPGARVPAPTVLTELNAKFGRDGETRASKGEVPCWKRRDVYDLGFILIQLVRERKNSVFWSQEEVDEYLGKYPQDKYTLLLKECLSFDPLLRPDSERLRQLAAQL